jgi:hypothetical protein
MGDAGDVWSGLREERQAANRARYQQCVAQAAEYPYRIQRMNGDAHWRIEVQGASWDFWPHSGRWQNPRDHGQRGRCEDFTAFVARVLLITAHPTEAGAAADF